MICAGAGNADIANISNIATECGLMYGSPRPQNGGSSFQFYPGTNWSIPLYACASTTKAVIKTVDFQFNQTDDLAGVKVIGLADKLYSDEASMPLWGVEKTNNNLSDVNAIWGLVSSPNQGNISLSTLRKESLYLPGFVNYGDVSTFRKIRNFPGTTFHLEALSSIFQIGQSVEIDYTGKSSLALARLWQKHSHNTESAHQILNLVWTDLAANSVVGTRGMHDDPKAVKRAEANDDKYPVLKYHRRIRYRLQYAVPAIFVLILLVLILIATVLSCLRDSGIKKLKRFLMKTSQARILTARLYGTSSPEMDSDRGLWGDKKSWRETMGRKEITLSQQHEQVVIHDSKFSERTEPLLQADSIQLTAMK